MLDKIGHIKNPLTVIAMFAAIAEVSGAIVLPFIAPENQAIYIWFLMLFPVLLVLIFFLTLNFNHKALYAPSDWKDESNFFRKFSSATIEERKKKLTDEVVAAEAQPDRVEVETHAAASGGGIEAKHNTTQADLAAYQQQRMKRYSIAESAAISKLSDDLSLPFQSNVVFHPTKSRRIIFDAMAIEQDKITVVEVKVISNDSPQRDGVYKMLLEAEEVAKSASENGKAFVLHYVVVLDNRDIDKFRVESRLRKYLNNFELNIKLHVFSMDELQDYRVCKKEATF